MADPAFTTGQQNAAAQFSDGWLLQGEFPLLGELAGELGGGIWAALRLLQYRLGMALQRAQ